MTGETTWGYDYRDRVAAVANRAVHGSYRPHPTLTSKSTRETLTRWLQTCDPNGRHTDELARAEDIDPYTLATAWQAIADMTEEDWQLVCPSCHVTDPDSWETWSEDPNDDSEATHVRCGACGHEDRYVRFLESPVTYTKGQ